MYNRPLRKRVSGSVSRGVGCWHVSGLCCGHHHAAGPYGVRRSGPDQSRVLDGTLLRSGSPDPVSRPCAKRLLALFRSDVLATS